jgi:hypothetical protein
MPRVTSILRAAVCLAGGAALGFAVGLGLAVALGVYERWKDPSDPSSYGGGLLIGVLTIPCGLLFGLIGGAKVAQRWTKGSCRAWL